ncbi:putative holin-like toxin [Gordoniibacillus kamchatkensis]|nr:putative holin-like toxin [Paenibacillus sp. VKM B-2647]
MEVFQALQLTFLFGMFILALLAYLKKKQTALGQR